MAAFHRHAAKQLVHIFMHDGRQKHKAILAIANAFRQPNRAGQNARRLHDCHARSASKRILAIQFHHKIQRFIQRARKRMRGIQPNGRENGQQFAVEIIFNPLALLVCPLLAAVEHNVFFRQRGQQFLVKYLILLCNNRVRLAGNKGDGFTGRLPRLKHLRGVGALLTAQIRHAHFKKFVQIGRHDAQEAQPFQQGHARVLRLRQHAAVKRQQRQFAAKNVRRLRHGLFLDVGVNNGLDYNAFCVSGCPIIAD